MFRAFRTGFLSILTGLIFSSMAWADTYAVLVGVGSPTDTQIQPRKFAEADVQAMYDLFVDSAYLGVPKDNIHLLLGKEDDKRNAKPATKENILAAVKEVVHKANKNDMVIFAFVGRGSTLADRTCFFTADSTYKERGKTALAMADLEQELKEIKSEKVVAFLDVNYKGIDPGQEKLLEPNPLDPVRAIVGASDDKDKEKEEHTLPQGRVIYLANINITPAVDSENHGLFTQAVLDGLRGAADKEGYGPDGNVTVEELDTFLETKILDLARQYGKSVEEKRQQPFDWGGKINHFVLTQNPAVMPKVKARLERIGNLKLADNLETEGNKLLAKMPKLKADQELRKLYERLVEEQLTNADFTKSREENIAGRKLSEEEAKTFARKVMQGINIVKSGYVKELEMSDLVNSAVKGMYRRLEEKLPDDVKEQLEKVKEMRSPKIEEVLAQIRSKFGKREDLEGNKDVDLALSQMMLSLDYPYTTYIDEDSLKKAEIDFRGRFIGIGISIRRDLARDGLLVVTPIKGSPAYKAGLKAGDLITEVVTDMDSTGRELPKGQTETVSTRGMKTEDAIKRILGKPNTKITVKLEREGQSEPMTFDIFRNQVNVETVLGVERKTDDSWDYMLDPKSKIGYIRLTQFTDKSSADMEAAVKKLADQGAEGVILDLRFNPGGLLDAAVEIADLFIDDGVVVSIRPRLGKERFIGGQREGSYLKFPMVCLVNGSSASGSEIVAATLQDHGRAKVIGERSYGKGSVQTIHQFRAARAEIKMTTATFWRPNGKNLNKPSTSGSLDEDWGVRPDAGFELKLDREENTRLFEHLRDTEVIPDRSRPAKDKVVYKDRQLEMGIDYLKSQMASTAATQGKKG